MSLLRVPAAVLAALSLVFTLPAGCDDGTTADTNEDNTGAGGKADSGWVGADTFEAGGTVLSLVRHPAEGEWRELATDPDVQLQLIDAQLKFVKTTAEANGWRFNQLADTVEIADVNVTDDGTVEILYEAVVDFLGRLEGRDGVPAFDDLTNTAFAALVPLDPINVAYSTMGDCSDTEKYPISDKNFHYYFAPEAEDCELETTTADVRVTEVFEREIVWPEYDRLLGKLEGYDEPGFTAALVPNVGDSDPYSRFNVHREMLERNLGLSGVTAADDSYVRFEWIEGGVAMIIDLYDPTLVRWDFARQFRERLGEYTLVHYNGHSSYGTKHLLDEPESFTDTYQIIMLHSCQSYAYYTRQVFRAKATDEDPSGFDLADVVATGKSSYPSGAPPTLSYLLEHLMEGMVAVNNGKPEDAPDWISIVEGMSASTWGDIMYGVAGVRSNGWKP